MQLVKELSGIEGVADIEPSISERVTHIHLLVHAKPFDERRRSRRSRWSRRCAGGSRAHPAFRPSITMRNPLGGGEQGGFPISAKLLGPDLDRLARLLAEGVRRGAGAAEPGGSEALAEHLQSRDPRRGGPQAGGRPRRPDGDGRRRSAPRRRRRRRDLDLS